MRVSTAFNRVLGLKGASVEGRSLDAADRSRAPLAAPAGAAGRAGARAPRAGPRLPAEGASRDPGRGRTRPLQRAARSNELEGAADLAPLLRPPPGRGPDRAVQPAALTERVGGRGLRPGPRLLVVRCQGKGAIAKGERASRSSPAVSTLPSNLRRAWREPGLARWVPCRLSGSPQPDAGSLSSGVGSLLRRGFAYRVEPCHCSPAR